MRWRGFLKDRRGSAAVLSVLLAGILVGMTALAVDLGQFYVFKRRLQSATDLAALAAVADIARGADAAAANLAANGFPRAALVSVERGTYAADPALPPGRRFTPGGGSANAVRVTAQDRVPVVFGRALLNGTGTVAVKAQAIGLDGDTAAFSLGTRLASLDAGLANAVLGQLLGTRLSLTLADYRALGAAQVDLFGFVDALAIAADLPHGSRYGDLSVRTLRLDQVLAALSTAAGPSAGAGAALQAIGRAVGVASGSTVPVAGLVSFGPFAAHTVGTRPGMAVSLDLLDMVFATARLSGTGTLVETSLGPSVPGVLDMTLDLMVGAPAVGTSFVALGTEGATLRTAQDRLLLTARIAAPAPLASVSLPLYVELAPATARLADLACTPAGGGRVVLAVMPGVADVWIGAVAAGDLRSGAVLPPPPATLASLAGLVTVTGRAHAAVADLGPTMVPFTDADVAAGRVKTVATQDYLASLVSSVLSSLRIDVQALGFGVPVGLGDATATALTGAAPAIDAALAATLATLGLSVGDADVRVDGLRCGLGFLAQ